MTIRQFKDQCRVCGTREVYCYDDKAGQTYCPTCCGQTEKENGELHEYRYDRSEGKRLCIWCSEEIHPDFYYDESP